MAQSAEQCPTNSARAGTGQGVRGCAGRGNPSWAGRGRGGKRGGERARRGVAGQGRAGRGWGESREGHGEVGRGVEGRGMGQGHAWPPTQHPACPPAHSGNTLTHAASAGPKAREGEEEAAPELQAAQTDRNPSLLSGSQALVLQFCSEEAVFRWRPMSWSFTDYT